MELFSDDYRLAQVIGVSNEAFRLLLSIVIGYPIGVLYRKCVSHHKNLDLHHLYFAVLGIALFLFNFGWDVKHALLCTAVTYASLLVFGGSLFCVIFNFVFQFAYLLAGYIMTETESYDIKWTMPHCVLTLRLIAIAFDVYDGERDQTKLSLEQKQTYLERVPTLLEFLGHSFFPASMLVGPQISMRRYQAFIRDDFQHRSSAVDVRFPSCYESGLRRAALGVCYVIVYQVGSILVPIDTVVQPSFALMPFWKRTLMLGLWSKVALWKYICCWILGEGSCIISGITYNGEDKQSGKTLWNGCTNADWIAYEGTTRFGDIIQCFNINTNLWSSRYVFKRLKFLNVRSLSHAATLFVLAMWHGLHLGYYMTFAMEFFVIIAERDIERTSDRYPLPWLEYVKSHRVLRWVYLGVKKVWYEVFMGYCLVPFLLISKESWFPVLRDFYFMGHIVYVGWGFYGGYFKMAWRKASGVVPAGDKSGCSSNDVRATGDTAAATPAVAAAAAEGKKTL